MVGGGQVISYDDAQSWQRQLNIGSKPKKLVVVAFTATLLDFPVLDDLARELTNVIFLKVDVNELKSVAADIYKVDAMPTFIFLKEGSEVDRIFGAEKVDLLMAIAKSATAP